MSVTIQEDMWEAAKRMPENQRAAYLLALLEYGFEGVEPESNEPWTWVFEVAKERVELSVKRSLTKKSKAENQNQESEKPNLSLVKTKNETRSALDEMSRDKMSRDEMSRESAASKKRQKFKAPTPQEVADYAKEQGYTFDGSEFVDFYESKGWLVGKSPMKDWKAACRRWLKGRPKDSPIDADSQFAVYDQGMVVVEV